MNRRKYKKGEVYKLLGRNFFVEIVQQNKVKALNDLEPMHFKGDILIVPNSYLDKAYMPIEIFKGEINLDI